MRVVLSERYQRAFLDKWLWHSRLSSLRSWHTCRCQKKERHYFHQRCTHFDFDVRFVSTGVNGQLGLGDRLERLVPALVDPQHFCAALGQTKVVAAACGFAHSLALTEVMSNPLPPEQLSVRAYICV